ncbi:hypothetical protein [Paracoccus laeviglucosivorans]|uniref:Uncharacterized protein n=1 Tax=Paracoccus laeviglucosivorans TaxID=1197861 RepID=A0A521D2H8_9RHOB|nr:hypothetical protein [Paracoccus laeviglucosivorans]SMO65893.1 hypothetical protein SAMN06265221_10621 [Paracoccus laeviglucosivorans]
MRFLILGMLTGAICALTVLLLGAGWLVAFATYSIAGTLGVLANALWAAYAPERTPQDEIAKAPQDL